MLIVDQLRLHDRRLRAVAFGMLAAMALLLGKLWYIQIASAEQYEASLNKQSSRTVRMPAIRGKILDRNGIALAENRPDFHVSLYLEELRPFFREEFGELRRAFHRDNPTARFTANTRAKMNRLARFQVASNIHYVARASLGEALPLNEKRFHQHYLQERSMPMPILNDLTPEQVALFMERLAHLPGVDLEVQPLRVYPYGALAAHLLGHVRVTNRPEEEEDYYFQYRLPDFTGKMGLEASFDEQMRGQAGRKIIVVNNIGYRESERVWPEPGPGANIVLALDAHIQQAAERALRMHDPDTRGAAVVMDVRNGDILAMASAPAFDPNLFVTGVSPEQWRTLNDSELTPMYNRAARGAYPPGSILKMLIGLAAFEAGILDQRHTVHNSGFFQEPKLLGRRRIKDDAPPGTYDFHRAIQFSCNSFFIHYGLKMGPERIIELGRRFSLGERTGIVVEEDRGYFPADGKKKRDGMVWRPGDTANLCIGQGELAVTPLQMTVMTAALANGGKVLQPRLVTRIEPQDKFFEEEIIHVPPRVVAEHGIHPRHLGMIHRAMLAAVEESGGTGNRARVPGLRICGKTGTAQMPRFRDGRRYMDHIAWFVSFAPYENPRYAVVVMVEGGRSGGQIAAPAAQAIYQAILKYDPAVPPGWGTIAQRE